jgi:gliding motility-associated-like protein
MKVSMKRAFFLFVFLAMHLFTSAQLLNLPFKKYQLSYYQARHIDFVENKGQWKTNVLFKAKLHEANIWLETDRLVFTLLHPKQLNDFLGYKSLDYASRISRGVPSGIIDAHAYEMIFLGSNKSVTAKGEGELPHYFNYFIGNDPSFWASEASIFHKIIYENLYDGIDLSMYDEAGKLKYDFIISPGSDPSKIQLSFRGVDKLEIKNQQLIIHTSVNTMIKFKPFAYQIVDGNMQEVDCEFRIKNDVLYYVFPSGYKKDLELIIDPIWVFGSYSGSTADNWGYTATYDEDGNLYAGGSVFNVGYPTTTGAYQVNFAGGTCDISISKFNSAGTSLIYSTYLGGTGSEVPHSLIVNNQNELYVYGTTGSSNFPMAGASYDNTFNLGTPYTLTSIINFPNGSDIIIARLNSSGTQLLSSTYVGGSGNDGLNMFTPLRHNYADDCRGEILIDKNDNIYVVSTTSSTNFPTTSGAFQPTYGGGSLDGVIFKMDFSLSTMIWSSYLGGSGTDAIYSVSLDQQDNPVVAGGTTSTNFPVSTNAIKPNYQGGSCDGFITLINKNGDAIVRSTYWGTSYYDQVYFVDFDKQNNIYVLGQTADPSSSLHTNAAWWTPGGGQFISKLSPDLTSTVWSTVFGTGGGVVNISPTAFLVDYCNNIYLSGWGSPALNGFGGTSGLPITFDAFQSTTDNNDYYFMALADDASSLVFGSYYGGISAEHVDGGTSRFDRMGKVYQAVCAGCGGQSDFPTTTGAWSNTNNSTNCNIGVIKIDFELPAIVAEFTNNAPVCLPGSVQFTNQSYIPNPSLTNCYWDFGDGFTSTNCNPSHTYSSSGLYTVTLVMSDVNSCNQSDTIQHQVLVLSNTTDTIPDAHYCIGGFTQIGIPPYVGTGVTYQWQPTGFLSNPNISNPICTSPGSAIYSLFVSDGVCTDTLTQRVNVYDIQVDAGPDTSICFLNHTLQATAWGGGGSQLQFQWSSSNQFSNWLNTSPNDSFANVTVTAPGWYYVRAFNQWCSAVDSVYIDFIDIGTNFVSSEPLCNGDCNGSIQVSANGGTPPYLYQWSNGDNTQSISNLCAGTYTITITDNDGCESVGTHLLNEPLPLEIDYIVGNIPCEEACIGAIMLDVSGGTQPFTYFWNTGATTNPITDLCVGVYDVVITDSNNCQAFGSNDVEIDYIYDNIYAWAERDTIWEGQTTRIFATYIPGVSYTWTPPTWLSDPNSPSPTVTPPVGVHWYYVVLDDGNGCIYTDSVKIVVLDVFCYDPYIFMPNAFSPDGDGTNDVLYVRGIYIEEMELLIFDRWGNLVFETRDQSMGWDGTYKGRDVDPGVFAYYLRIVCFDKTLYTKKGNITLIR